MKHLVLHPEDFDDRGTGVERLNQFVKWACSKDALVPVSIKKACRRHKRDLKRKKIIYFDVEAANAAISMAEQLPHTKGKWQGQPTVLQGWQCFLVGSIFGWKWTASGLRRFRYVYEQVPRKNGKTHIAVIIGLLMFGPDNEPGAEIMFGATGETHARKLLFKPAKFICDRTPAFTERFEVKTGAASIWREDNMSSLVAVIKKPDDGDSPHCAVVDEYHEHDNSDQWDTFNTGMGAREQPLLMISTTAGSNLSGPCNEEYRSCQKLLDQVHEDDTKFVLIYEPDKKDDWQQLETVIKVNPNYDVSVFAAYLETQLAEARRSASKQNAFRTKHLNQWVGSREVWMNQVFWQKQADNGLRIKDFEPYSVDIALDLASKKDVAAKVYHFMRGPRSFVFSRFYIPEGAVEHNDMYTPFIRGGYMTVTGGNKIDQALIEAEILEDWKRFRVRSIVFDPYQADYIITRLQENIDPNAVMEYPQNVKNMSTPMKEVEADIIAGDMYHDNNPCMNWMIANVTARIDAKDNIYPRKEDDHDPRCKIDGAVALIMAKGRALTPDENMDVGVA